MQPRAIVLLSGGLDSVFNLYASHKKWQGAVEAVFFEYGQRASSSELRAARYFSESLKVPLQVIDISSVFSGDQNALTGDVEVPTGSVDIESHDASMDSAQKVWVANRNGVFLNLAACIAEKKSASFIVPGFNREEAGTFPDNSVEYIEKMNACLKLSTANAVQIHCFSQDLNKTEIFSQCLDWKVNMDQIWSCYFPGEVMCGQCESCQRFLRAQAEQE